MKQLLELVLQDDGTLDIKCPNEKLANKVLSKKPKEFDRQMKEMISKMTKLIWGEKSTGVTKLIRFISMAEMCACAEPYSQAEEFWGNMMFSLIPRLENYCKKEKRKYAKYSGASQRPINMGGFSAFNLSEAFPDRF